MFRHCVVRAEKFHNKLFDIEYHMLLLLTSIRIEKEGCRTMQLKDQVIIVTGGGRGIGRALSLGFATEGAIVVLAGRTEADLTKTEGEIRQQGGRAISVRLDVTDEDSVRSMVRRVIGEFGVIDTLVNNAGVAERQLNPGPSGKIGVSDTGEPLVAPVRLDPRFDDGITPRVEFKKLNPAIDDGPKPIVYLSKRDWDTIIATNLTGPFLCSREVLPYMLQRGRGNIVTVASGKGMTTVWGIPAYVSSKHGVLGLMKQLAFELKEAGSGINVNSLIPGGAISGTGPHQYRTEYQWAEDYKRGRVLPPAVLVPPAVFLASQEPFGIVGKVIEARAFAAQNFATREATETWLRSL